MDLIYRRCNFNPLRCPPLRYFLPMDANELSLLPKVDCLSPPEAKLPLRTNPKLSIAILPSKPAREARLLNFVGIPSFP